MTTRNMISFDWAIKRLLRNKANFGVLEGFLSELLNRKISIKSILESEGNQDERNDKYNRVDVFVEADDKELLIIELQFYEQDDYFQRMLYGASKSIVEYLNKGDSYDKVRKVYSINIVYFDLGTGDDYIYYGRTVFIGLHSGEELLLTEKQRSLYNKMNAGEFSPEYYLIKVKNFNDVAKNTLDEWVYYLKNDKIPDSFTAQGLEQAREVLAYDNLSDEEKKLYNRNIEATRIRNSEAQTAFSNGEIKGKAEGRAEGRAEGEAEKTEQVVMNSHRAGLSIDVIAQITNLTVEQVTAILKSRQLPS